MGPHWRIDVVRIALSDETLEIPWDSREQLVDRVSHHPDGAPVVAAFRAAGTSEPVKLDAAGKRTLLGTIATWLNEVTREGLPAGIYELQDALLNEYPWDSRE